MKTICSVHAVSFNRVSMWIFLMKRPQTGPNGRLRRYKANTSSFVWIRYFNKKSSHFEQIWRRLTCISLHIWIPRVRMWIPLLDPEYFIDSHTISSHWSAYAFSSAPSTHTRLHTMTGCSHNLPWGSACGFPSPPPVCMRTAIISLANACHRVHFPIPGSLQCYALSNSS